MAPDGAERHESSSTVNSGPLRLFVTAKPCRESEIVLSAFDTHREPKTLQPQFEKAVRGIRPYKLFPQASEVHLRLWSTGGGQLAGNALASVKVVQGKVLPESGSD